MANIADIRGRIEALAKEVRALVESHNDDWKPEHQARYDQFMAEIEDAKAALARLEAINAAVLEQRQEEQIASAVASSAKTAREGDRLGDLYVKWLRGGDSALTAQDWRDIRATMSTTTGSEGGYTVQSEVAARIIETLKYFGGMRVAANVVRMTMGNDLSFPGSDGTSEVGELIGQNATATAADPTFTTVAVPVYKYSSKIVAAPFELLQDSQVDIAAFIERRLAQRIGRITNQHFTTGTGTGQPAGVASRATLGKTGATGQTTTVTADDLIDLVHAVDPAYRASGNCVFMMHDLSLAKVRKLKDTQNRPIFLPGYDGLAGAMPDTLLGYRVIINNDVAQMAANARSILFGDFKQYLIRDVMDLRLFRFEDSAYAKLGQVGFLMWHRAGGNLLDTAAVKYYANSAT